MKFLLNPQGRDPEFVSLFRSTFSEPDGPAEGDLLGEAGSITAF